GIVLRPARGVFGEIGLFAHAALRPNVFGIEEWSCSYEASPGKANRSANAQRDADHSVVAPQQGDEMTATRLIVHGRVQGVGYRAWLAEHARRSGITGWVRNRRDGTVEALLCAGDGSLDAFVAACRQGPLLAGVTDIEIIEERAPDDAEGFAILPTA
ncbi:MAG TPA: acylphosphatase, partial [Ancylobacter sp.]